MNGTVSSRHRGGDDAQPRQHSTSQIEPCRRITSRGAGALMQAVDVLRDQPEIRKAGGSTRRARDAPRWADTRRSSRAASRTTPTRDADRSRMPAGVASVSGLKFFHSPSAPRNVGTPLAAETPAPVMHRDAGIRRESPGKFRRRLPAGSLLRGRRRGGFLLSDMNSNACGRFGTTMSVWLPPGTSM